MKDNREQKNRFFQVLPIGNVVYRIIHHGFSYQGIGIGFNIFFAGNSRGFNRNKTDIVGSTDNNLFFPAIGLDNTVH